MKNYEEYKNTKNLLDDNNFRIKLGTVYLKNGICVFEEETEQLNKRDYCEMLEMIDYIVVLFLDKFIFSDSIKLITFENSLVDDNKKQLHIVFNGNYMNLTGLLDSDINELKKLETLSKKYFQI